MREIKFRAWDFERKEMFIPDEFIFDFNINSLYQIDRMAIDSLLMQYTGLKDKNDKEIYEGDILRNDNYPNCLDAEVLWYEDAFRIRGLSTEADIEEYLSEVNKASIIIGNIYENSDSINKKII